MLDHPNVITMRDECFYSTGENVCVCVFGYLVLVFSVELDWCYSCCFFRILSFSPRLDIDSFLGCREIGSSIMKHYFVFVLKYTGINLSQSRHRLYARYTV